MTIDGVDWTVINGKAFRVENAWDRTLHAAARAVGSCTDSSMSKEEKLKSAFRFLQTSYLEGVRHNPPYREADWPVVCADDLFVYGKGDCFSYGAAFAFMGKAIGCDACYACNSGGHGWAEIEGLIYDPEWSMHSSKYSYYAMRRALRGRHRLRSVVDAHAGVTIFGKNRAVASCGSPFAFERSAFADAL